MKKLKQPYLRIELDRETSYGGNQGWFSKKYLRDSACGVIGAADVISHLKGKDKMSEAEYMEFAGMLQKRYLPVIPKYGINGLVLMFGLNRYFQKQKMPYRCFWGMSGRKMISRMDQMLENDIPVILSVGPNFPNFWGKQSVKLYKKITDEKYVPVSKARAHYMIATGRAGTWIRLSTWGREYYMDYKEYREYVRTYSSPIVSNIVCIKEIKKIK